jgi:hypothetical protein
MSIKYFISNLRPSKIYSHWDFWFENKPSGNPGICTKYDRRESDRKCDGEVFRDRPDAPVDPAKNEKLFQGPMLWSLKGEQTFQDKMKLSPGLLLQMIKEIDEICPEENPLSQINEHARMNTWQRLY